MLRLDKRYKRDDSSLKVHTLELFETYKRPSNLHIPEFIIKFEKRLHKVET